jgi:hypothetical protein
MARKKRSSGNGKSAAAGGGIGASGGVRLPTRAYSDRVPNHTFASSTMPRATRKMASPHDVAVHPGEPDTDDLTQSGTTSMSSRSKKRKKMASPRLYNPSTGAGDGDADDMTGNRSTSMQGKRMQAPNRSPNASAYRTPDDDKQGSAYHLQAVVPTRSRELAAAQKPFPKKGIIKPSRKGLFTAKAKAAGMSVQGYASSVLSNPKAHDPQTVRQANFARNFGGAAKRGGSS